MAEQTRESSAVSTDTVVNLYNVAYLYRTLTLTKGLIQYQLITVG